MYPRFYDGVIRLMTKALLETHQARSIVRKAGIRQSAALPTGALMGIWGNYARLDPDSGAPFGVSPRGSTITWFEPREFSFPLDNPYMSRLADMSAVGSIRLVATVTKAGPPGTELVVSVNTLPFGISMVMPEGPPAVPLDVVGVHVSDYKPLAAVEDYTPDRGTPVYTDWLVTNPDDVTGEDAGIGLVQLQARGAAI